MRERSPQVGARAAVLALVALAGVAAPGCRNEMYDQPRFDEFEANSYFADGNSARPLVPGVVPRLDPRSEPRDRPYDTSRLDRGDRLFATGRPAGSDQFADALPTSVPLTAESLKRGQQRFQIYCSPCHGQLGDGKGMIVERGFSPPPSLYKPEVVAKPLGHYFDVITHGHGAMYGYAARIPTADRWLIASFIRALQLSQAATPDQLPAQDRQALDALLVPESTPSAAPAGDGHAKAEGRESIR